jgi:hypothetical protein
MGLFRDALGLNKDDVVNPITTSDDDAYKEVVQRMTEKALDRDNIQKGYNGQDNAVVEPIFFGSMDLNMMGITGYRPKYMNGNPNDLHLVLKNYSNDILLNTIILTRANKAMNYAEPARSNEDHMGFQVRLKDISAKPTPDQMNSILRAERYIEKMGVEFDPQREDFRAFLRQYIFNTYVYDQVNYENTFSDGVDGRGVLNHTRMVDPTTVYYLQDKEGKRRTTGKVYAQVDPGSQKIVRKFDAKEMAFFIRNPRTDVSLGHYGTSELEIGLRQIISLESTEVFNDRFFSHGGTTRGIINIKAKSTQSRTALEAFKREFQTSLGGINGAWRLLAISAEDVQFVNLTPQAQDMQFESWLNYLHNSLTALFGMDPAEIGMTNRGGASGSKASSLNEGNNNQKIQSSNEKGLAPLLKMIAADITKNIIHHLIGDNFVFEFVGGDFDDQVKKLGIIQQRVSTISTPHEEREMLGNTKRVPGDDIILNQFAISRYGQIIQMEQIKNQQKQTRLLQLQNSLTQNEQSQELPDVISYQDQQTGFKGKPAKPSGKKNQTGVDKTGQVRSEQKTNTNKQGGKN